MNTTSRTSLTQKQWIPYGEKRFNPEISLFKNFCVINNKTPENFSQPLFSELLSPSLFNDAEKTREIIFEAIEKKERIMIFGDYDLDGMSGTAQIFLTLKMLGAEISYRLPSRQDGYGLSDQFIQEAAKKEVKLFITTDCGISNHKEFELAKKLGIKAIITDHHSIPNTIPDVDAIWHPLLPGENFPDKDLTGSGVAWYFCADLLQKKFGVKKSQKISEELLELAVLGTVADCGALQGENRKITLLGLNHLQKTNNKGLQELIKISGTDPKSITAESIGFFLGPRLNASGRLAHPRTSLELLLGNPNRAADLEQLNKERQNLVQIFLEDAQAQLELNGTKDFAATLVASEEWLPGVIGLIAGKLAEQYGKPTIAFAILEDKITGSCRGPENFNIVKTIRSIANEHPEYFLGYGGHAEAAGLSLYPQYFQDFCLAYTSKVEAIRGTNPSPPKLSYLCEISREISIEEVEELEKAEPFGIGNPSPLFLFPHMEIVKIKTVGKDATHLSLFLKEEYKGKTHFFSGIFFQSANLEEKIVVGEKIDIIARPKVNIWNNEKKISLQITDMRTS